MIGELNKGIFITGTGTGVGKTLCSSILLRLLRAEGIDAVPMKPIQTGSEIDAAGNHFAPDLDFHLRMAEIEASAEELKLMNPYLFKPACSPHLAAEIEQRTIRFSEITKAFDELSTRRKFVVVEGAGGVFVPIDSKNTMVDLMLELELPVVVVANSQLGTINHTLLTLEALKSRGINVSGLILTDHDSNASDDFIANDNTELLSKIAGVPLLMRVPFLSEISVQSISDVSTNFQKRGFGKSLVSSLTANKLIDSNLAQLRKIDHQHLWHAFTDINRFENSEDYTVIERSKGSYLIDVSGNKHLDGISSWWCANLGHGNKKIISALQSRSREIQQCILGDLSHSDAIYLAEELAAILPGDLNHVFFASDGSSAVEASLKIALQYWWNRDVQGKKRFIYLANSYHGDTLGAISVGFIESFHASLTDFVWPNYPVKSPLTTDLYTDNGKDWDAESFAPMEKLLVERASEVAAVIVEPLCQAAGGMRIYSPDYLKRLRKLCSELGVLLIADEIAVGFGRTGTMFACQQADVVPDIMVLGKGMTSGAFPMSATVVTPEIYNSFRNADPFAEKNRTFFHGHTFSGHPLAAACARAAIKVFKDEKILELLPEKSAILSEGFVQLAKLIPGSRSNALGMIGMLKVPAESGGAKFAAAAATIARSLGLFIRPLGDVLYLYPPLTTSAVELKRMIDILGEGIKRSLSKPGKV